MDERGRRVAELLAEADERVLRTQEALLLAGWMPRGDARRRALVYDAKALLAQAKEAKAAAWALWAEAGG